MNHQEKQSSLAHLAKQKGSISVKQDREKRCIGPVFSRNAQNLINRSFMFYKLNKSEDDPIWEY